VRIYGLTRDAVFIKLLVVVKLPVQGANLTYARLLAVKNMALPCVFKSIACRQFSSRDKQTPVFFMVATTQVLIRKKSPHNRLSVVFHTISKRLGAGISS
jgi:hypothetical protein